MPTARAQAEATASDDAVVLEIASRLSRELHPRRARPRQLSLQSVLEQDVGLDSLGRVELFLRIERAFGASLPEASIAEAETLQDVASALHAAPRVGHTLSLPPIAANAPDAVLALPDQAQTLLDVLRWHAQAHGDRVHMQLDRGGALQPLGYAQLLERAQLVANGLAALGTRAGQSVAIMLPTELDYFEVFFAALLIGAVPVPLYPPARASQIASHLHRQARILSNAEAGLLVTTSEVQRLGIFMTSLAIGLRRIVTPEELRTAGEAQPKTIGPARTPGAHDVALLQYTSGSTGDPKGVILTHANLLANVRAMGEAARVSSNDVMVSWLPLYHDMGLIGAWLGSLYHGCPLVLMSPLRFLSRPARWLWAIHASRGTLSPAPNFAYELCASRLEEHELTGLDLSSWRMALNGAEPVSPTTVRRFCERFARYGFRREAMAPVYGLAECSVGLAFPPQGRGPRIDRVQREPFMRTGRALPAQPNAANALEFADCGQPLPRHEIRIVDPAGRELPDREQGKLQFRGPSATRGYLRNPRQTAQLFDGPWLESGDLGYAADGGLYVTGRSKDIIFRAGRNVHPHELEDAIGRIDGVRKGCVAVFGSADPKSGTERIVVVAETRAQDEPTRAQLRERIARVATTLLEAAPDDIVLAPVHSVPKTTSGKLRRSACKEAFERGALRSEGSAPFWQLVRLAIDSTVLRLRRAVHAAGTFVYAGYALTVFCAVAPIAWLLIVALPRPSQSWAVLRLVGRGLLWLTATRLHVEGADAESFRRARVLVSNHASYLDGLVLAAVLPVPVRFVAKAELARSWLTRLPLRRLQVHFVERSEAAQSIADARGARDALRADQAPLLFFPEGTLTRAPGVLDFHMGAFATAATTGSSLLPLVIRGTRSKLRDESWFLRRGPVEVRFGPLLVADGSDFSAALRLRAAARDFMLASSGEPDLAG